jgi:hypothetical protein
MAKKRKLPRRGFLKTGLTAAATAILTSPAAGPATAAQQRATDADELTAYQLGPQIWIRRANRLLTSYRAHPTQKYPYLYPLSGPVSGLSLTTETSLPYPHHRSLMFACDQVNGGNYWQDNLDVGQIISSGPQLGRVTPRSIEIIDQCHWRKPGEPPVLRDERIITVRIFGKQSWAIDTEIKWIAVDDVTIPKTNHSLFAMRVAKDLAPTGGGTLLNSEEKNGEKATFGKAAKWCGFFGERRPITGETAANHPVEGIAIMEHPQNPWSPCPWFTRDYGFASATPFQFIKEPWQLQAGKSVTLRYRVVVHAGNPQQVGLDHIYQAWAAEKT